MSLVEISIKNYKSVSSCVFHLNGVTALLGENGTGKSNILSAVRYFYDNLISRSESDEIFDHNNRLNNRVEIALTYDLGRLKQYARVNLRNEETRYASYYEKILGISAEDTMTVRMIKIRDMPVRWSHDADTRKLIAGLFPLYFVDARQIDLVNWEVLWKLVGDLVKPENMVEKELRQELVSAIGEVSGQMKSRLDRIQGGLERKNIKIEPYSRKEFAVALSKLYLSGERYQFDESSLAEIFSQCRYDVRVLLATHSARLIRNILVQEGGENQLYQVYRRGEETKISRFQMFRQDSEMRERYFITDQHASAYFARALFLVEGETELEVFQSRFLKELYPLLGQAELIKGMSDDVVYRIVSPKSRGYRIPVTILMDLDKVYTYPEKLKKKYFHMCRTGENYFFYKKTESRSSSRATLAARRKRIYRMAEKCRFHYIKPLYLAEDENYREFVSLIQEYFREYGIFIARTTIEGMLVTMENLPLFLQFLKKRFPACYHNILPFYRGLLRKEEELTFVRLLLGGECDYGMNYRGIKKENPAMDEELKRLMERNLISKTSWAADWLCFYFCRLAGFEDSGLQEQREFFRKTEKEGKRETFRKAFERDFPELGELMHMVCGMIRE